MRKLFKNKKTKYLATVLVNLEEFERESGNFGEALKHFEEGLKIKIDLYGDYHIENNS